MPSTQLFAATLVYGASFQLLRSCKRFERGKAQTINESEKAYLEEHAVDRVIAPEEQAEGEPVPVKVRSKFRFEPIEAA